MPLGQPFQITTAATWTSDPMLASEDISKVEVSVNRYYGLRPIWTLPFETVLILILEWSEDEGRTWSLSACGTVAGGHVPDLAFSSLGHYGIVAGALYRAKVVPATPGPVSFDGQLTLTPG